MNWDAVFEKALTPGFVPNVSGGPMDVTLPLEVPTVALSMTPTAGHEPSAGHGHWGTNGLTFRWDSGWI